MAKTAVKPKSKAPAKGKKPNPFAKKSDDSKSDSAPMKKKSGC